MSSDKFRAELNDLTFQEYINAQKFYVENRFIDDALKIKAIAELQRALLELSPAEPENDEPLLRVGEFCESVGDPPPMVVAGLLEANTVMLVSALPKTGKSFLMMQMADDIASGTPLFGQFEIEKPGPVVYLMMEGSRYQTKARIVKRGMDVRNPEVYIFHTRRDLSKPSGVKWLCDKIAPLNPSLVIVDTARQAFNMDDWNNASLVQTRLQPLVEAVQRNSPVQFPSGTACIIVHHNNKSALATGGNKISGSNAFQGIVDGYMILDNKKRLPNKDLQFTAECEGRIDLPESITFVMDYETLHVRAVDEGEAAALKAENANAALKSKYALFADLINKSESGLTAGELETKTGIAKSYVSKILSSMGSEGRVMKAGTKPTGGKGSPAAVYVVPPQDLINSSLLYKGEHLNATDENEPPAIASDALNSFFGDDE